MIGAGDLDRRITVERATSASNDFNEPVEAWAPHLTLWARREDVSDGEKFAAGQVGSTLRSRFVVRSSEATRALTAHDRLTDEGSIWSIHGVKETKDGRHKFIEITAVKDAD